MRANLEDMLSNEYGITFPTITTKEALSKVESSKGTFMAKTYHNNYINQLEWIDYFLQETEKKGFSQFPKILRNKQHKPWTHYRDNIIIVSQFIEGRHAKYTNLNDVFMVLKTLANFHQSAAFIGTKKMPRFYKPIHMKFQKRLSDFKRLYQFISQIEEKGEFEKQVVAIGSRMIEIGSNAIQSIDKELIKNLQQEAYDYRQITHRDTANHNFLIGEKPWIIDFDLAGYEPQILDLYQVTGRILQYWKWDMEIFYYIEEQYDLYKRLSEREKLLNRQLLLFPNDFFREILGVYYYPDKYHKEKVKKLLTLYTENFDKLIQLHKRLQGENNLLTSTS